MKHPFLGFLTVAVLLAGCAPKEESPIRHVSNTYSLHTCDTLNALSILRMDFEIEWPCREDSAIEAIRQDVMAQVFGIDAVGGTIENAIQCYSDTLREQYRQEYAVDESMGLEAEESGKIYHRTTLSIDDPCECFLNFQLYEEQGSSFAPHDSHFTYYLCYDRRTGKRITERELFKEGFEPALTKLLSRSFWYQYGRSGRVRSLENIGMDVTQAEPNGNFFIGEDYITYFFQENEIACYAEGPQTATVPLEDLREWLNDTTIIHHHE